MTRAQSIVAGDFGRISILDVDEPVFEHAHPQCHVLIKIGGTDSEFQIGELRYPLHFGTAVLVDSWRVHSYPYNVGAPAALILALYIEPKWLAAIDRKFSVSCQRDFFLQPCVRLSPATIQATMEIAEEAGTICPDRHRLLTLIENAMVQIITSHSRWKEMRLDFGPITNHVADYRIRRAVEIMMRTTGQPEQDGFCGVAHQVGLSRAHFFDLFKQNTSLTPRLFRNMLRMEAAYEKVLIEGEPLRAVSQDLGFHAQSQFSRFFTMNHGVSPSAYRRRAHRV